jgi:hypothetical protein
MIWNVLACAAHRNNPHDKQDEEIHFTTHTQISSTRSNTEQLIDPSTPEIGRRGYSQGNFRLLINNKVGGAEQRCVGV